MTDTTQVLHQLNSYSGDNLWQDVILTLDGYDEDATDVIDPNGASDRFVADGVTYVWHGPTDQWDVRD